MPFPPSPALLLLLLAAVASGSSTGSEDLLSARCQSKCLSELERRHNNDSESRRLLRHQMSSLCREDVLCSSCILPCGESIYESELCARQLCRDTADPTQCRQSCAFIESVAANKPGSCPGHSGAPNSECSAFCDTDSDCPEVEKCCSVGCSRTCLGPGLNDSRLLPRPEGITVQERKRKRSAILRWVMKRLSPQHTSTNSNLFVVQWRWSVHKQPETMTPWQTVMVRNKMYAILKHLLAPGRYYLFRVAAVNKHGTYGFSGPSHPAFKLSKEVKAPSAPINLTVLPSGGEGPSDANLPRIGWTPPESELPLKEYRLSWWKSSAEWARAFEYRQRRHSGGRGNGVDEEDYDAATDGDAHRMSAVLPSYSTRAQLSELHPGQVYAVELYATADSSEGELRGEPALIFVSVPPSEGLSQDDGPSPAAPVSTSSAPLGQFRGAELKTPYFENGRLKTSISWLDHAQCAPKSDGKLAEFRVFIHSVRCLNELPPQHFVVRHCVATLENLQFRCEYYVGIERMGPVKGVAEEEIARLTFSTQPCEQTPSDVPLQCAQSLGTGIRAAAQKVGTLVATTERRGAEEEEEWVPIEEVQSVDRTPPKAGSTPAPPSEGFKAGHQQQQELRCSGVSGDAAECTWNWPEQGRGDNNPLVGFRTVLSSTLPGASSKVSIVGPEQRHVHLGQLSAKAVYRFRLQAVTTHGLGAELVEHFSTGHLVGARRRGDEAFPESAELPWSSSYSAPLAHHRWQWWLCSPAPVFAVLAALLL